MNDMTVLNPLEPDLETRSDDELDALISEAKVILEKRKREKDKKAWEEIQNIAKSRGFAVAKKHPRGRPSKKAAR